MDGGGIQSPLRPRVCIDRLVHHSIILEFDGASRRVLDAAPDCGQILRIVPPAGAARGSGTGWCAMPHGSWPATRGSRSTRQEIFAGKVPDELRGRFLDQYVSGVVARDAVLGMDILLADDSEFGAGVRESSATKVGFTRPEELADRMLACVAGTRNSDMLAPFVRGWLSNNSTKASTRVNDALTGTPREIDRQLTAAGW